MVFTETTILSIVFWLPGHHIYIQYIYIIIYIYKYPVDSRRKGQYPSISPIDSTCQFPAENTRAQGHFLHPWQWWSNDKSDLWPRSIPAASSEKITMLQRCWCGCGFKHPTHIAACYHVLSSHAQVLSFIYPIPSHSNIILRSFFSHIIPICPLQCPPRPTAISQPPPSPNSSFAASLDLPTTLEPRSRHWSVRRQGHTGDSPADWSKHTWATKKHSVPNIADWVWHGVVRHCTTEFIGD